MKRSTCALSGAALAVIAPASAQSAQELLDARYPPHEFFDKLGMKATVAETDILGEYVLSSQVRSTAWDLAAFS
jgi:hypothetical protein